MNYTSQQRIEYFQYDKDKINFFPESKVLYWNIFLSQRLHSVFGDFAKHNVIVNQMLTEINELSKMEIPFPELAKKDTFNFDLIKKYITTCSK